MGAVRLVERFVGTLRDSLLVNRCRTLAILFVAWLVPGLRCADPGLCSLTPLGLTGAACSIGEELFCVSGGLLFGKGGEEGEEHLVAGEVEGAFLVGHLFDFVGEAEGEHVFGLGVVDVVFF